MPSPELFPPRFRDKALAAADGLKKIDNVLIASHVNPDGDALGSIAATGWLLHRLGKNYLFYVPGGIPDYLRFLELPGPVCGHLDSLPFTPESGVYVDCSEASRLGPDLALICQDWPTITIDHHICANQGLGSIANFIDTAAAATCQLMAYVALSMDAPLREGLGEAIGLGLLTDTGQFSHGNTSPSVFVLAAALEVGGLDIPALGETLRSGLPIEKLHLWGALFQRCDLALHGKVAFCLMFLSDLAQTGCQSDAVEGFVDRLRDINGVEIGLLIRQISAGKSKYSMRSRGETNVQLIATHANGGGHKNAAGGIVNAEPQETLQILLNIIDRYFRGELS